MRNLDELLSEAESIIEKKAEAKQRPTSSQSESDKEVAKLANLLVNDGMFTEVPIEVDRESLVEKVAHSLAIVQTLANAEHLAKIAEFHERAVASGYTDEQIFPVIEKIAKKKLLKLPWKLLSGGLLAGGAGAGVAHKKGKDSGYEQAVKDVETLLSSSYPQGAY